MASWIFASEAGAPLDESRVAKRFGAVLRVAELPRFRLYDLRHSFAPRLARQDGSGRSRSV
jgi:integrase